MPPEAPSKVGVATIREIGPGELAIARDVLSQRDERRWDDAQTEWFLQGLDPERCRAWVAVDGDKPVGLTSYFLRTMARRGAEHRVAYWANLYVDPDYRNQMLYPRLPMTMLRSLGEAGAELLYAAVRIPEVGRAHLGMGFAEFGGARVLVRPLKPFRFLVKHKGLPRALTPLVAGPDALFGAALSARAALGNRPVVGDLAIGEAPLTDIAAMLARRSAERLAQVWTAEGLAERYRQTREGGEYRCLVAERAGGVSAALVYRFAQRGAGIDVAVVMDLVCRADNEADAVALCRRLEKIAGAAGCELVLMLDGLGEPVSGVAKRCGFRPSPENYTFMVYPKKKLAELDWFEASAWEYAFRDHDAF